MENMINILRKGFSWRKVSVDQEKCGEERGPGYVQEWFVVVSLFEVS